MEKLLSPKEVASVLSLSVETVYRWIENGTLPAIKVGKRAVRISEKSLKAWLDNQPAALARKEKQLNENDRDLRSGQNRDFPD